MLHIITRSSIHYIPLEEAKKYIDWSVISVLSRAFASDLFVSDLLAYMRGESMDTLHYLPGGIGLIGPAPQSNDVDIVCSDGQVHRWNKETLTRNFHYFDQYFSARPQQTEVVVDLPSSTVGEVLGVYSEVRSLAKAHAGLVLLRPKNRLFFLEYNSEGCGKEIYKYYMSKLNDADKGRIADIDVESGYASSSLSPPSACVYSPLMRRFSYLAALYSSSLLDDLWETCPSYMLWVKLVACNLPASPEDIEREYPDYKDLYKKHSTLFYPVITKLVGTISKLNKVQLGRLMAMFGVKNAYFENEGVVVTTPGGYAASDTIVRTLLTDYREDIEGVMGSPMYQVCREVQQTGFCENNEEYELDHEEVSVLHGHSSRSMSAFLCRP